MTKILIWVGMLILTKKSHFLKFMKLKLLKDLKRYIEFYEKITFIEDIYAGETVKYAIEKRGKTIPTGHAWLKAWNEEGFDGLLRKEGSGRKTKLSEKQFEELKENIIKKQLTSVREVKHEIIEEFGVTYSDRQIRRIMKNLGFG